MFSKETYVNRRAELKKLVKSGIIILFGNNESPANFPANGYYPFRQDSSFLYYFGPKRDGLVGVIDVDNDKELLIGNDIDIDDIVWYGSVDSVHDMAERTGVKESAPMKQLQVICDNAMKEKRTIHFLPPYRHDTMIQIFDLLGIHPSKQREAASVELIKAVVKMRSTKEQQEIEEIERACAIGYKMHTTAMRVTKPGVTEKYVGGQVNGIANSYGAMVSFPTIFSQHGEIMHGNPSMAVLESGRLALCDCGGETMEHYCSDNTRTFPVNGKFTQRQLEIYSIVEDCHDLALKISKPGVKYFDGHMMGMDVHDMEGLGQTYVGFDDETRPNLEQFGTNCLRMGRRLEEGFVVTDEPGIYFIPALIDEWRAKGLHKDFINYEKLETYKDFGGIRIEDDILITSDGCRFLGEERIPYHPKDVEEFMSKN